MIGTIFLGPITGLLSTKHIGMVIRFFSVNYPNKLMRHRNSEMWLDRSVKSGLYLKDSSFVVVKGLAGKG